MDVFINHIFITQLETLMNKDMLYIHEQTNEQNKKKPNKEAPPPQHTKLCGRQVVLTYQLRMKWMVCRGGVRFC
jgi:hypothetical protein